MTSLVFFAFGQQTVGAERCPATLDLSLLGENHRLLHRWLDRLRRARLFFETTDDSRSRSNRSLYFDPRRDSRPLLIGAQVIAIHHLVLFSNDLLRPSMSSGTDRGFNRGRPVPPLVLNFSNG